MDRSEIERRVGAFYTEQLQDHGSTARGVAWNSEESQRLRFHQLLKVAPPTEEFSLNDYGCGYAALLDHVDEAGLSVLYHGHDFSSEMVASARERHGGRSGVSFGVEASDLPVADVTVASGIFNVLAGADKSSWRDYVYDTAREMAELSRHGIAFNMLTTYSDWETEGLYYADPCEMFDWCKRELSRHVTLIHDYGLYEFTMIVRFDEAVGTA